MKWRISIRSILVALVVVVSLGALLGTLVIEWNRLPANIWADADWSYLGLAICCHAAAYLMSALIWTYMARQLCGAIPVRIGLKVWFQSLLVRMIPGGVWPYAARVYLAERYGLPREPLVASCTCEAVLTFIAPAVLAITISMFVGVDYANIIGYGFVALALLVIGLWILIKVNKKRLPILTHKFAGVIVALNRLTPSHLIIIFVMSLTPISIAGVGLYCVATALHLGPQVSLLHMMAILAVARIAGFLVVVSPGGLGITEGIMAILLLPSYGSPASILVALLFRLTFGVGELLSITLFSR